MLKVSLDTAMSIKIGKYKLLPIYSLQDPDEITLEKPPIGDGSFGTVYKGDWRGQQVAIKILKNQHPLEAELKDFENEVRTMEKLKSPYVCIAMLCFLIKQDCKFCWCQFYYWQAVYCN